MFRKHFFLYFGVVLPPVDFAVRFLFAPVEDGELLDWVWISLLHTWCGRKVMRLATLCTNRQRFCLPFYMAVRLTPAVDPVQVWTCYICYAIVESAWSEVVFVRCVTKMDRQKFGLRCAIKFCVKLGESATVTYEKLQRAYGEHSLSRAQVFRWHKSFLEGREQVEDEPRAGRPSTSKTDELENLRRDRIVT